MNKKIIFLVLACSVLPFAAYAQRGGQGLNSSAADSAGVTLDPDEDIYRGVLFGADKKKYEGVKLGDRKPIVKKRVYDTSLIHAIKVNDPDRVRTLLFANIDVNEKNYAGITPLAVAAEKGNMDIIRMLVENGNTKGKARVNDKSSYGVTPLIAAAAMGRGEVIKYLVDHEADVTVRDDKGKTALLYAVRFNQPQAVESLIRFNNSTVNLPDNDGNSPLFYAAQRGLLENVKILIKYGADPDYRNPLTGQSPLLVASAGGYAQVAKTLVKNGGADIRLPDRSGRTAIFYAVNNNRPETLRTLLSLKANINEQDLAGTTPLMVASAKNSIDCINVLLRQKKTLKLDMTDLQGRNALFYSAYADSTDPADKLLTAGLNINSTDAAGNTPLMTAIKAKNELLALFFLQQGADLTVSNRAKENAFTLTRRYLPRTTFASVLDVKRADTEQQLLQVQAQRLAEVRSLEAELEENEATANRLAQEQADAAQRQLDYAQAEAEQQQADAEDKLADLEQELAAQQQAAKTSVKKVQTKAADTKTQAKANVRKTAKKLDNWADEDPDMQHLKKAFAN